MLRNDLRVEFSKQFKREGYFMSTSANPDRPNRLIMGLGIATVVLLAANLISVLAQRVWPALQDLAMTQSEAQVGEIPALTELSTIHIRRLPGQHTIVRISPNLHEKFRYRKHVHDMDFDIDLENLALDFEMDDFDFDFDFEFDEAGLDVDLERLEREIERETSRIERDLSSAHESLEGAIRLQMRGKNAMIFQRHIDLADLEEKLKRITAEFSTQAEEHSENAERHGKVIVRKRKK